MTEPDQSWPCAILTFLLETIGGLAVGACAAAEHLVTEALLALAMGILSAALGGASAVMQSALAASKLS